MRSASEPLRLFRGGVACRGPWPWIELRGGFSSTRRKAHLVRDRSSASSSTARAPLGPVVACVNAPTRADAPCAAPAPVCCSCPPSGAGRAQLGERPGAAREPRWRLAPDGRFVELVGFIVLVFGAACRALVRQLDGSSSWTSSSSSTWLAALLCGLLNLDFGGVHRRLPLRHGLPRYGAAAGPHRLNRTSIRRSARAPCPRSLASQDGRMSELVALRCVSGTACWEAWVLSFSPSTLMAVVDGCPRAGGLPVSQAPPARTIDTPSGLSQKPGDPVRAAGQAEAVDDIFVALHSKLLRRTM